MTTRHKKRLAAILLRELGGLEGERAVERLSSLYGITPEAPAASPDILTRISA